jgi:hypothetical protein
MSNDEASFENHHSSLPGRRLDGKSQTKEEE